MSADAPHVVVDTNVLVAATDTDRASHAAAVQLLTSGEQRLAVTPQILREYLAVATRPTASNGLGLTTRSATANMTELLNILEVLEENLATSQTLLDLVGRGLAAGKQVHDANVAASAITHQVPSIVTDDVGHFTRFADLVQIESLPS